MCKFSIRMLAAAIAALAVSLGLLRYPYPPVAYATGVFLFAAIALAAFIAIGSSQPARSFWLGFVVGSLAVIWNSHSEGLLSWGLPHVTNDVAMLVDGYLGWATPPPDGENEAYIQGGRIVLHGNTDRGGSAMIFKPIAEASYEELKRAMTRPSPDAFRSIFADLAALLFGLLGGCIAWAARRHAMRNANDQPSAG